MHLSGQTPLLRARNLEKHLGMETIYLKLEGGNPTGHKNDRIAESLVQFAYDKGYTKIFVHGTERYLRSLLYFANAKEIEIMAPKSKETTLLQKHHKEVTWLDIKVPAKSNIRDFYESYAGDNDLFFSSEWEKKPFIRGLAIQKMMEEALDKLPEPTHVWTQINGGYTLRSLYHECMRSWVNGNLAKVPGIHCGVKESQLDSIIEDENLQEIIVATDTEIITIEQAFLKETVKLLKRLEHITISASEAYALAALIQSEPKENGTHIVFLNDGKNDIEIKEISKDKNIDKESIIATTRKLLEPYHDSIEETADAVQKAIDVGFIFKATQKEETQGICIIVHMGFKDFIPSYHLAYIGVKKGNKGRGVATELINQAIEKTKGNLSLHVDIPNNQAKKLYEKMGFVHTYDRMLYKG